MTNPTNVSLGARSASRLLPGLAMVAAGSIALSTAASADTLHFTFSPDAYFDYDTTGTRIDTPVTGSFDFDTVTAMISNVDYHSVSGDFTTAFEALTPAGNAYQDEVYFTSDDPSNYDVYQLGAALSSGGDIEIVSGTHPNIPILAGGSLLAQTGGAVPEPAAWATMMLGFGLAGAALRQRAAGQRVRVTYS